MMAGLVVSCDPAGDPGMIEKVALLEAELRDRDQQLAAMQEESKSDSDSGSTTEASAPDLDAARGAYLEFVEGLRSKLVEAMPDAKFERPSVFPVEGPDPSKPIFSKVAFRVTAKDGRSGEMVIPVFADPSGAWQEPETEQIIAGFKTKAAAAPVAAPTPAPQPVAQKPAQPTDVMGASRTVEVQWDDGPRQPPGTPAAQPRGQAPPPSQPAPPPAPSVPKKVMPTDRDVIIDFE